MKTYDITVAVTGLNATDNPGPGVGVIRSIREAEQFAGRIVGLAYDPLDPGVYMSGVCDHVYLFPYPSQGKNALLARLEEIHAKNPLDVIVPTLDAELMAFVEIAPQLERLGIHTFLPSSAGLKLRDKAGFAKLKESHGIRVPAGVSVSDPTILYNLPEPLSYPLMVKGRFYDASVAHTPSEAERLFHRLSAEWGLPVVVQEYVNGEEYDVVAVGDGGGGVVGAVPMRKLRLTDKGKAWGGITVYDAALEQFTRETLAKLKWRGPCELEIIKPRAESGHYAIEINPRFPAWSYLAAGAGQNLPWLCVMLALGERTETLRSYDVGAMFLRHSVDMVYPLASFESIATFGELHQPLTVATGGTR